MRFCYSYQHIICPRSKSANEAASVSAVYAIVTFFKPRRFVEILPSKGSVQRMCADFKVPMLPSIPMDPALVQAGEQGRHLCSADGVAPAGAALALQQLTMSVM